MATKKRKRGPNPLELETILISLWTVIDNAEAFLASPPRGWFGHDADLLEDVRNLLYQSRLAESLIGNTMQCFPAHADRLAHEARARGNEEMAAMLEAMGCEKVAS
jgi:hypothetical protein